MARKHAVALEERLAVSMEAADRDDFSPIIRQRHKTSPSYNYEFKLMTHVVRSAGDIFRARCTTLGKFDPMELEKSRFVTVNFKRNDIPDPRSRDGGRSAGTYLMWETAPNGLCYTRINRDATPTYSRERWIKDRELALSEAMKLDPDVVLFGEYDYPPQEFLSNPADYDRDIENYDNNVKSLIGRASHPVIFLAGSRHERQLDRDDKTIFCSNTAYLFPNREARIERQAKLPIHKRSAAKKVGELLSAVPGISMEIFQTFIGNVAVLVCSDAYDPNIISEMVLGSRLGHRDRVDFFLVPAYNISGKLVKSCQVLSYFTNSAVLYCNSYVDNGDFELSEFFLCGERLSEWRKRPFLNKGRLPAMRRLRRENFDLYLYEIDHNFIREVIDYSKNRHSRYLLSLLKSRRGG